MGAVKNFVKFTGAPLLEPFLLKKKLWHRCFPVNFAKFLRISIFIEHLQWLILYKFIEFRNQNVNPIQDGLFRGCSRMEGGGRWLCFKFNNLDLVLGMVLKFYTSVGKGLKQKVRKFCGLIPMFVEVTGEKLVVRGGVFWPPLLPHPE